jgi:hypothetical protein
MGLERPQVQRYLLRLRAIFTRWASSSMLTHGAVLWLTVLPSQRRKQRHLESARSGLLLRVSAAAGRMWGFIDTIDIPCLLHQHPFEGDSPAPMQRRHRHLTTGVLC